MDAETQGVKLAGERPAAKEELRHATHGRDDFDEL